MHHEYFYVCSLNLLRIMIFYLFLFRFSSIYWIFILGLSLEQVHCIFDKIELLDCLVVWLFFDWLRSQTVLARQTLCHTTRAGHGHGRFSPMANISLELNGVTLRRGREQIFLTLRKKFSVDLGSLHKFMFSMKLPKCHG